MTNSVLNKDIFWGYVAQGLNIGAGILLLPIILRYLPAADVGLWFVFMTLAGFSQLIEMGFQPTLARNVAYAYSGAKQLAPDGLPNEHCSENKINLYLVAGLISAAKKIYLLVAVLATFLMLVVGSIYIYTLLTPSQNIFYSLSSWITFALGYLVNFYFGYITGVLQGRGDITQSNKVVILARGIMIILGSLLMCLGFGLLGLGVAVFISAVFGRIAALHYLYQDPHKDQLASILIKTKEINKLKRTLWHNASRLGMVQLGGFLIQRVSILISSSFMGLEVVASYGMTLSLLLTVSGIAAVICHVQVPYISALQSRYERKLLSSIYGEILILSWAMYFMGLLFILIWGKELLWLIDSHTMLLPFWYIFALGVIVFLEMNHSIAATYLTTMNKVPFLKAALFSGILILIFSLLLIKPLGLIGLIIAQGGVQLAYNNWKWPREVCKQMGCSLTQILSLGIEKLVGKFKF